MRPEAVKLPDLSRTAMASATEVPADAAARRWQGGVPTHQISADGSPRDCLGAPSENDGIYHQICVFHELSSRRRRAGKFVAALAPAASWEERWAVVAGVDQRKVGGGGGRS
jgi:hypothetical protein